MKNKLIKVFQLVAVALLMCLAVASAETDSVTFKVSANDWPNHQDSSQTKNIPNAYVNMYLVRGPVSDSVPFKVYDVVVKNTGSEGVAEFTISPGQMVYFEGFRTSSAARQGYEQKKSMYWTAPPYKNFGNGKLCQTNYLKTNEFLGNSEDYACANTLSTPYVTVASSSETQEEATPTVPVEEKYNDLGIRYWGFGKTAFKAQVCNYGTTDISGFKIKFKSNEKENVLTYVPTLTKGNCLLITSWGYSYFGLSEDNLKRAEIVVDPDNEIVEEDEANNRATVFVPLGEIESEQNAGPIPNYNEPATPLPVTEKYNDLAIRYWGFGKTAFKAQVCNYGTTDLSGFKIKFESNEKENVLTYAPTLGKGDCVVITSWGYSHFGLSEDSLKRASIVVDPYNEIEERSETNNRGLVFVPLGEVESEQQPKEVVPPTESKPTPQSAVLPVTSVATPNPSATPVKPVEVETTIPPKCFNSCSYDGSCLPFGTKIKDDDKGPIFCDITGKLVIQKAENAACQNNYECLSNSCVSGKCLDLEKKLQEQQNLLDKILAWLGRLMGGAN